MAAVLQEKRAAAISVQSTDSSKASSTSGEDETHFQDAPLTADYFVFESMGMSPNLESPAGQALRTHFLGALPGQVLVKRVAAVLEELGFNADNTLYGQSVCPDEINHEPGDVTAVMRDHWGECFPMGGIGGYPAVGRTGFGAFSHHVPEGGNLFVLLGPHVGISPAGDLGKYLRDGQSGCYSSACGAIIAAIDMCKRKAHPDGEDDEQQAWLCREVDQHMASIDGAPQPVLEATRIIHDASLARMRRISNHGFGSGSYALLTGIQINLPRPYDDHFLPLTFEVSSAASPEARDLLPMLHRLRSKGPRWSIPSSPMSEV